MPTLELIESFLPQTGASPRRVDRGRDWLPTLCRELGYTRGVEVGTFRGDFAEQLCQGIPNLELLCVDPWADYPTYIPRRKHRDALLAEAYQVAAERLIPYRVTLRRAFSIDAARDVPDRSYDFIYIDANHEAKFVYADLKAWVPKVRVGGIVAGHDYWAPKWRDIQGVKRAVKRYVREHEIDPFWVLAADLKPTFLWFVTG